MDYTSDDSFLVHWHGFIDHESGIKLYRIGLSHRCLGKDELYNFTEVGDIYVFKEVYFPQQSVRVLADFTGQRFVTVIALNNAMEPSKAVCSDGITRDLSPPEVRNITLQHAAWSESIACNGSNVFLLETNFKKVMLQHIEPCRQLCTNNSESTAMIELLPYDTSWTNDTTANNLLCQRLNMYESDKIIYLPNDHLYLQWDVLETGSQVDDFYVGIGIDKTEFASPIIEYVSTSRKTYFKRRHDAIGSNELFYIFLKAVNKAGLENIYTVGPVLIDETAPLYTRQPDVIVNEDNVIIAWNEESFYDDEQTEPIDRITFQIGNNRHIYTT